MAACGAAAGFDVLQVLSEPTAVAIAHRADEASVNGATGTLKRCVVVDLGASGLDVAVMTVNRGVISVDAHEHTDALSGEKYHSASFLLLASLIEWPFRPFVMAFKRTLPWHDVGG